MNYDSVAREAGAHARRRLPPVHWNCPRQRKRCVGRGRRYKLAVLRQEDFERFLARRSTTAARSSYVQITMQARLMCDAMITAALRKRERLQFPRLTRAWFLRWRREYQVSLSLSNRR